MGNSSLCSQGWGRKHVGKFLRSISPFIFSSGCWHLVLLQLYCDLETRMMWTRQSREINKIQVHFPKCYWTGRLTIVELGPHFAGTSCTINKFSLLFKACRVGFSLTWSCSPSNELSTTAKVHAPLLSWWHSSLLYLCCCYFYCQHPLPLTVFSFRISRADFQTQ